MNFQGEVRSKLDPDKQAAFIKAYENLLNQLGDDEAVLFGDAVHPTHAVRPVGCWAPKDTPVAVPQTSGRQRLNIHGAIDLETGKTRMIEAATVNAISMIMLLRAIEAVQAWLARPGCRVYFGARPASNMFKLVLLVRECDLPMVRLLGIDPGLRFTGWGLIDVDGNRLQHVADGVIATDNTDLFPPG